MFRYKFRMMSIVNRLKQVHPRFRLHIKFKWHPQICGAYSYKYRYRYRYRNRYRYKYRYSYRYMYRYRYRYNYRCM